MKIFRIFFIIAFISITPFTVLQAQTTTASTTETGGGILNAVLQNVSDIKETVQEKIEGKPPASNPSLKKETQKRIINLAANISNRFDGIIARLQNISGRLNKRIKKQAEEGYDVRTAQSSLEAADKALNEARDQMRDIDTAVVGAIGSPDPRGEWKKVRINYLSSRDAIRIAHTELKNTVSALKNAQPIASQPTSTTTPTQ